MRMTDTPRTASAPLSGVFKFNCDHCGREVVTDSTGHGNCGGCRQQYQMVMPVGNAKGKAA